MNSNSWTELIKQLEDAKRGILFDEGLTVNEIRRAEESYQIQFPPDLRDFLQTALPLGLSFPNWRADENSAIRASLRLPGEGVLFDVESNEFWLPEWGPRPSDVDEALTVAAEYLAQAPRLIPVCGHRMMPERPHLAGNPVLSVHQTDIIYYGFDLDDYFRHEFNLPGRKPWPSEIREIPFWEVDRWQDIRW